MPSVDVELDRVREVARSEGVAEARRQWFDDAPWFEVIRRRPEECRAEGHRAIVSEFSGAPWLYQGRAAAVAPIDKRLAVLELPVLLYNGEHDLADFVAAAARLEELLPRATRATIPEAGGFPAWEFPHRVNRLVAEFLSSPSGAMRFGPSRRLALDAGRRYAVRGSATREVSNARADRRPARPDRGRYAEGRPRHPAHGRRRRSRAARQDGAGCGAGRGDSGGPSLRHAVFRSARVGVCGRRRKLARGAALLRSPAAQALQGAGESPHRALPTHRSMS